MNLESDLVTVQLQCNSHTNEWRLRIFSDDFGVLFESYGWERRGQMPSGEGGLLNRYRAWRMRRAEEAGQRFFDLMHRQRGQRELRENSWFVCSGESN